eukprot:6409243-Amphidinium_carterae.1
MQACEGSESDVTQVLKNADASETSVKSGSNKMSSRSPRLQAEELVKEHDYGEAYDKEPVGKRAKTRRTELNQKLEVPAARTKSKLRPTSKGKALVQIQGIGRGHMDVHVASKRLRAQISGTFTLAWNTH